MRTSTHSSPASRLSSRFRILASLLESKGFLTIDSDAPACADLMLLAGSDFPGLLRSYGANIRGRWELLSRADLPASEEFFIVVSGLRHCIASSRNISWIDKGALRTELDEIESVVSDTLDHDEGTLLYRDVRQYWRKLKTVASDSSIDAGQVGIELRRYTNKRAPTGIAHCVAMLAHCSDEEIPRLCRICPMLALEKRRYCSNHSPSLPGKKGYERGQRVWSYLLKNHNALAGNRYPLHQEWRQNFRVLFDAQEDEKKWLKDLFAELQTQLGKGWRKRVAVLSAAFSMQGKTRSGSRSELVKSIDRHDSYAPLHPRYFARKIAELLAYVEADGLIPRRNVFSLARLMAVLNSHGGSTRLAAAELKISQRRVQMILKKNLA